MPERNNLPSFEQTVLPHLDAAYNLARWLTLNKRDAEDVVQESYLRAFRNTCYTWLHANRPLLEATEFDETLFSPDSRSLNPEESVLRNDRVALVRKALETLPANFREVLILRELEGLTYKEIAEITGMPAGTVMSSLSRARDRLRQVLTMSKDAVSTPQRIAVANT
jgi:RNA polymerase sigma-70 factor, ECF subfamily